MAVNEELVRIQKETVVSFISPSLHELGESPVPASNIVTSPFTFFLVFLCLVYQTDDIYRLQVQKKSVASFVRAFNICLYIL
jgi:hypothetical protein